VSLARVRTTYRLRAGVVLAEAEDLDTGLSVAAEGADYDQVAACVREELRRMHAELGGEGLVEWQCPSCGATTRARMADR
jgi:hypothetical protein